MAEKEPEPLFLTVAEVQQILGVSKSSAQKCIRFINDRLKAEGKFTLTGKVNRYAFAEMVGQRI